MQEYQHNESLKFYYPDDWDGGYDDGLIFFENSDNPMGALLFTVFYPPADEEVSLIEWLEEMLAINPREYSVKTGEHYVRFQHIIGEGRSWRYWAIKRAAMVLFGSYNCDLQDQGKEDQIADDIIESILCIPRHLT